FGLQTLDDGAGETAFVSILDQASGHFTCGCALWNGSEWAAAPPAMVPADCTVYLLSSLDLGNGPRIYGVRYVSAQSNDGQVMEWTGSQWGPLAGEFYPLPPDAVEAFDDGTGPHLYAIGGFWGVNGVNMNGLARWNGAAWEEPPLNNAGLG